MTRIGSAGLGFPAREITSEKVHQEQIHVIDTTRHWLVKNKLTKLVLRRLTEKHF